MTKINGRACGKQLAGLVVLASVAIAGCFSSNSGTDRPDSPFRGGDINVGFAFGEMRLLYLTESNPRSSGASNALYGFDIEDNAGVISHALDVDSGERVMAYSPSPGQQRLVAYTTRRNNAGNLLWIADLDASMIYQASGHGAPATQGSHQGVTAFQWNHTGEQLIYLHAAASSQAPVAAVWDFQTRATIDLVHGEDEIAVKAIWSPDDRRVIYATRRSGNVAVYSFHLSGYSTGLQTEDLEAFSNLFSRQEFAGSSITELGVSANGQYVHLVVDGNTLHVLDQALMPIIQAADIIDAYRGNGDDPLYARWSDTGATLAYVNSAQHLTLIAPAHAESLVYSRQTAHAFSWGQDQQLAFVTGAGDIVVADDAGSGITRTEHAGTGDQADVDASRIGWAQGALFYSARGQNGHGLFISGIGEFHNGFHVSDPAMRAPVTFQGKGDHLLFPNGDDFALFDMSSGGGITSPAHGGALLAAAWTKPGLRDRRELGLLIRGSSNVPRLQVANAFGDNLMVLQLPIAQGESIISFKAY